LAPRLLGITWPAGSNGSAGDSEVVFALSEEGDKVRLVLTHRRLPDRAQMVGVSGGWHSHLAMLEDRLNGREPRGFWTILTKVDAEYESRIA
jgi:Activator of Hsp90 ATPase homolog 1-like protein